MVMCFNVKIISSVPVGCAPWAPWHPIMSSLCLVTHHQWMLTGVLDFNSNPSGASGDPVFNLSRSIQFQRKHAYLTSTIHTALCDYTNIWSSSKYTIIQRFEVSKVKLGFLKDYLMILCSTRLHLFDQNEKKKNTKVSEKIET